MDRSSYKIYCAGPLFNPKEQEDMSDIANVLENVGYNVFLPHRDGLEYANILPLLLEHGIAQDHARYILNKAIFSLDVYQILHGDGLVLNVNGRVPDEGAMVEAGIAWAHDKPIVIFNTDTRSLVQGSQNPLVMGLSDFEYVSDYEMIPDAFDLKFQKSVQKKDALKEPFEVAVKKGETISKCLYSSKSCMEITKLLISLFGEATCQFIKNTKKEYTKVKVQH